MNIKDVYWMKQSLQENLIYLAVWGVLFATPLLSMYVRTISGSEMAFDWGEVYIVWQKFALYLLLFLIHNFLLVPLLVHGHKRITYFSFVAIVLTAFTIYQCNSRPDMENHIGHRPPPHEMPGQHHHPPFDEPRPERHHRNAPPPIVGERDILAIVVLILMFGANLGIKGYFRSRDDRKRLAELERENLEQQLEYLRYQINPHFFMNTLNNIHALVDIDPAKAQETIVELSKMMRFVLYEGDKQGVSLSREFEFIRTYIKLMRLRYTDKVKISLDLPADVPDRTIPPLILISFVENAFKHGISYQRESFIEIAVSVSDMNASPVETVKNCEEPRLHFLCRNSKAIKSNDGKGGVGLANVRKRLDLLYDRNYSLRIQDTADVYTVELIIPLTT